MLLAATTLGGRFSDCCVNVHLARSASVSALWAILVVESPPPIYGDLGLLGTMLPDGVWRA